MKIKNYYLTAEISDGMSYFFFNINWYLQLYDYPSRILKMKMFRNDVYGKPEGGSTSVWTVSPCHVFESSHWLASLAVVRDQSGISFASGTCGLVKINNRNIERQRAAYGASSLFGGDASATRLLSLFMVQQEEDKCSAVTCDEAWQGKNAKPHKLCVRQAGGRIWNRA